MMTNLMPNEQTLKVKDPMILFGALMFFFNRFMDVGFNLPVAELFLPLFTFYFARQDKNLSKFAMAPGFTLTMLFLGWIVCSNIYHDLTPSTQFRNLLAISLLFFPVFFFAITKNRDAIMKYILGNIVAFGFYSMFMISSAFLLDGVVPRPYRELQLTPMIPAILYVMFREQLSKPLRYSLIASTVFSIFITYGLDTRGPAVGMAAAFGFYLMARFTPWSRFTMPLLLCVGLLANYLISFNGSSYDVVANSESDTMSNLERAYAIDYCRDVLAQRPWFGDSPQGFPVNFSDSFAAIMQMKESRGDNVETPHNSFFEYASFFGYPAGIIFILLMFRITSASLVGLDKRRTIIAALGLAGILRLAAFYGLSGIWRIEWFTIIFALYYTFYPTGIFGKSVPAPVEPESVPEPIPAQKPAPRRPSPVKA